MTNSLDLHSIHLKGFKFKGYFKVVAKLNTSIKHHKSLYIMETETPIPKSKAQNKSKKLLYTTSAKG